MAAISQFRLYQEALLKRVAENVDGIGDEAQLLSKCGFTEKELAVFAEGLTKGTKKVKEIPEEHQCLARVWDKQDDHKRCSKRRADGMEFCCSHGKPLIKDKSGLEWQWEKCGRVDQAVPEGYRGGKKRSAPKKEKSGLKRPKSAFFFYGDDRRSVLREQNQEAKMGEIAKMLGAEWKGLSEEQKKPYVDKAEADKARYYKDKSAVNVEEAPAPVQEAPAPVQEAPVQAPVKEKSDQTDDEDDDDDEIGVMEYIYKGQKYYLDPNSKKVYNMDQEFVGKLKGKKINFDAVDSDNED